MRRCFLLTMFCVCKQLRSDSKLYAALMFAIRAVLPERLVQSQLDALSRMALPQPWTLTRLRFTLDCAYMVYMRRKWEQWLATGCVVYMGVDASPQGGRNYEMLVMQVVLKTCLPMLHSFINCLDNWRPPAPCVSTLHSVILWTWQDHRVVTWSVNM